MKITKKKQTRQDQATHARRGRTRIKRRPLFLKNTIYIYIYGLPYFHVLFDILNKYTCNPFFHRRCLHFFFYQWATFHKTHPPQHIAYNV